MFHQTPWRQLSTTWLLVVVFQGEKNVATVVGVPRFSRFFLDGVLLVRRENIHNPNSTDDHLIS